jgi:uncharacterized protein YciI
MFIISINYLKSLEEIDSLLEEHIKFLKKQYAEKVFIASGRKVPRTGGIIIAKTENKEKLNAILKQDPFYKNGAAEYQVTEFIPSMTLPEFANLNEA